MTTTVVEMRENDGGRGGMGGKLSKTSTAEAAENRDDCGGGGDLVRWRRMMIVMEEMWDNDFGGRDAR